MLHSTYFPNFITVCTTVILLSTLSFMEAKATFIENKSPLKSSFHIVDSSVSEEEDAAYVRQVLLRQYQGPFNDSDLPSQGTHKLNDGDSLVIWSPHFPEDYPPNAFQKWIFKPEPNAKLILFCPIIRIRYAAKCKHDRLTVFKKGERRVRKGERRCGRINDYSATFDTTIKVTFVSNGRSTNIGYFCNITCQIPPTTQTTTTTTTTETTTTTSTTTTTFMPGCRQPVQLSNPKTIVSSCSDLDPAYSGNCVCTECSDGILLTCDICTLCDMDVLGAQDFRIPVNLMFTFTCPYPMSLSSYYGVNGDDVVSVTVCVTDFLNNPVDVAFEDLTNLQTVAYRDCSVESSRCIYDPCSPGDVCESQKGFRALQTTTTTGLQRQQSPITITIPTVSLAGVQGLYVADVCLSLDTNPLTIESLKILCINEASGCTEFVPNSLDCPNLQQVSINTCQGNVVDDTFSISSDIECLDIKLPCTYNLDENFIALDNVSCDHDVTVRTKFNEDFYKYIPHCPYHAFLEKVCIDLVFTTVIQCRECGNYWLSKISTDMLARVHGICYDSVSLQNYTFLEYFTRFTHPCDFLPLQLC